MSPTCRKKERTVVPKRFVLSLLPDSIRLSSNMASPTPEPYVNLDTDTIHFAPYL
jgi:hypothetical protein